jgi:hypothetical protein
MSGEVQQGLFKVSCAMKICDSSVGIVTCCMAKELRFDS